MRLVADLVRGQKVESIKLYRFSSKELKIRNGFICIANGKQKTLKLIWKKQVYLLKRVDGGMMLKDFVQLHKVVHTE
jgi:hypothetical protein